MKDKILYEDLLEIAKDSKNYEDIYNSTVFVTGATGLVGSYIIRTLLVMNEYLNSNIRVIGFVRNADKAKSIFEEYNTEALEYVVGNITEPIVCDAEIDYIIHTASPTASKYFVECPVETILTAVNGTNRILELARNKKVKGMVYLSSMEAFGITDTSLDSVREKDLGYIDILNVRSSYSEGKRICECLCASYASEYNVPVKIGRLAQTFGAGISKDENRVFAQFAKSAIKGEDIILHTEGKSVGNYCYTADAVRAIFTLLVKGKNGEAYTIVNEKSHMQIREMAQMVVEEIADNKIKLVFDIPEDVKTYGYAPDVCMKLNADKIKSLGWSAKVDMLESYKRMIESMKQQ